MTDPRVVVQMISLAARAGNYRQLARQHPEARSGLLKMAAKNSQAAAILADAVGRGADPDAQEAA